MVPFGVQDKFVGTQSVEKRERSLLTSYIHEIAADKKKMPP